MLLNLIKDIEKALEAKAYLSALALALTIPDICGKMAYPNLNGSEPYKKWFDEYLSEMYTVSNKSSNLFDSTTCYKLRCAFLHAGNTEKIPAIDEFELGINCCDSYSQTWKNNDVKNIRHQIRINVDQFCQFIITATREFYNKNIDLYSKADNTVDIIDLKKKFEYIQSMNNVNKM